jgi:hypothetical protein
MCSVKQFHGGTNFGRSAGGPFITTSYDYDAPIDEYGKDLSDTVTFKGLGTHQPFIHTPQQYNLT